MPEQLTLQLRFYTNEKGKHLERLINVLDELFTDKSFSYLGLTEEVDEGVFILCYQIDIDYLKSNEILEFIDENIEEFIPEDILGLVEYGGVGVVGDCDPVIKHLISKVDQQRIVIEHILGVLANHKDILDKLITLTGSIKKEHNNNKIWIHETFSAPSIYQILAELCKETGREDILETLLYNRVTVQ